MGGNALKTVATARLAADAYFALADRVLARLADAWPQARPHLVRSYAVKPDFGDMDVLVDRAGMPSDVPASLRDLFGCREVVHNGPVWSCDVEGFQVDLLTAPSADYAAAADYFAFNDAGNLMGRVARRMGFKYGHDGLRYVMREGDYVVADLLVSNDMPAVFDFLGYSHADFSTGFDTLEQMFAFVAASPYFDPGAYALEQRNHVARTRDRKRASYRAFLDWSERTSPPAGASSQDDKAAHLARADALFPGFATAREAATQALDAKRARRQLFNGERVAALTGLGGAQLGALMARLRTGYPGGGDAFDAWLDTAPAQDEVDHYIKEGTRP